MNDQYNQIKLELELTKRELEDRLNRSYDDREPRAVQSVTDLYKNSKKHEINQHIFAELNDVNRALFKMEWGLYGICEETGEKIPYELLRIVPTVRTLREALAITEYPYTMEQV
ncbi:TraR/DksA C4-type zinc finger protein [Calidifontibacillus erzurumensis]|uniref:TraR/DksA C4-type zinc finger protein n=1 Tax=Calidifontibacillus erzurumensis TaxID=2741433 RepID=UPI0035B55477